MLRAPLTAQYRAVLDGCGLWRQPVCTSIVLIGEDRARLLNGLVTCDVGALTPGQGAQGFFTDVKGHILAEVVVRSGEDTLLLQLPTAIAGEIAAHIRKHIVADRVEVQYPVEHEIVTLLGPHAADRLAAVLGDFARPTDPWSYLPLKVGGVPILVADDGHYGVPAVSLWSPPGTDDRLSERMLSAEADNVIRRVTGEAVDLVRVEKGVPLFGRDYDSRNLPQESGLDAAVSFDKGCYLGQEVVARLHYRGQIARRVSLLRSLSDAVPEVGCELLMEGRGVGTVTSVAEPPDGGRASALAMLRRRALEPGTELLLPDGGSLQVV